MTNKAELINAVQVALNGDLDSAHQIVQKYTDTKANWLHALLHKLEGDEWNSKYWYARTGGIKYEDFTDSTKELIAIEACLVRKGPQ